MLKHPNFLLLLVMIFLAGCEFITDSTLTPSAQPSPALPDLVVSNLYLAMQGFPGGPGNCVPAYAPYEIRATVQNQGQAVALNFPVVEASTGSEARIEVLEAGQTLGIAFPATSPSGTYNVSADPQNQVPESNEDNNVVSYLAPTPTPPVLCPPTSPMGEATLPPLTPSPQSLEGLIYADMNLARIWKVLAGGHAADILQGTDAQFSPDGLQALFEQSGDLWLAEPMDHPGRNITNTPNVLETSPQWWSANPSKIVFNQVGVHEAQEKGWTRAVTGYVAMMDRDGSNLTGLAAAPSWTRPALSPDGKTIAYDTGGRPTLYEMGAGERAFDPAGFGSPLGTPEAGMFFTSPSFSPDGRWLTWWVAEDESQAPRHFSLVVFDLAGSTSSSLHTYTAPGGTSGWLDAPLWSPGGQWVAFQTRGEAAAWDLWIMHTSGGIGQRLGLADHPVWSPDGQRLAYVQWPPHADSYLGAAASIIHVPSWSVEQTPLSAGSIPLAWTVVAP